MKRIKRASYLKKIKSLKDKHVIKIITGVRRCGKSTLLMQFDDYLRNDLKISKDRIIFIKFDDKENEKLKNPNDLYDFFKKITIKKSINYYVLLDEIQDVKDFEPIVLDLYEKGNVDIYLTGSNSYMLSGQIATKFTGRSIEIHVMPFSFNEFIDFKHLVNKNKLMDKQLLFNEYRRYGGFPLTITMEDSNEKINWLNDLYKQSLEKDILPFFQIKDKSKFKKVTKYLFENIANITSSSNIANVLHIDDSKSTIDHKTIDDYIECLCNAFLMYQVSRYDIKGKELLKSKSKFYAVDTGFRNCIIGNVLDINRAKTLENIVYLELVRRGFKVYVGYIGKLEIDFVATKGDEKIYIQVCESIEQEQTLKKELFPLLQLKDSYPKYLIVGNSDAKSNYEGIKIINIIDWLLDNM